MFRKIFLDIDGVCNRLIMQALALHSRHADTYDDSTYPLRGDYRIVNAVNCLRQRDGRRDLSAFEFWARVERRHWANAPHSAEYAWLFAECVDLVGPESVCFLTSPVSVPAFDADSAAGKREWIARNAPAYMRRQSLIGVAKEFCASPGALLIDDSDDNCKAFVAAGGSALLVPRPWNSRHASCTATVLRQFFQAARVEPAVGRLQALGLVPRAAWITQVPTTAV
jgi:hypothetical protein